MDSFHRLKTGFAALPEELRLEIYRWDANCTVLNTVPEIKHVRWMATAYNSDITGVSPEIQQAAGDALCALDRQKEAGLVLHCKVIKHLISTIPFTPNRTQHRQYTSLPAPVTDMSAPPKRKWTRGGRGGGRGGGGGGGGDRTNGTPGRGPANPRSAMSQQPKRPRVEDTLPKPDAGVDVRQMYSTAAGDAAPKPFADLKNKLHPALLNGLDKMGFE
ncbi:uncharacterized protein J4E78_003935 [Alternaria triticimaculans]|uniref:uncharacterized protein n=1 Tax=Alternaria triticimaculans TaxID=297637 RepID=UPI0020C32340|nr:uncharacterized protein J4E78_003935 [Alternaria triticimaculans]KAI4663519.1 hypothetical protein J4E78_003935 [Alternaria triticimaculans]